MMQYYRSNNPAICRVEKRIIWNKNKMKLKKKKFAPLLPAATAATVHTDASKIEI